ncbi:hypothetical protein ScPMuIL_016304 [Solemya velum]
MSNKTSGKSVCRFDPQFTKPCPLPANQQSDSQKAYLRQQYLPDKLYRVSQDYAALDLMDLSVIATDLVGLIKQQDPMGNKNRWFVDTGASKGFLPTRVLTLYQTSPSRPVSDRCMMSLQLTKLELYSGQKPSQAFQTKLSPHRDPYSSITELDAEDGEGENMEFALGESMLPDIPDIDISSLNKLADDSLYFAEYSFESRSANEVSLFEGQVVSVLLKEDLEGNSEWWLVDADGTQGYTPAIYLKKMSSHYENT